jgi:hypothetical protein
LNGGVPTQPGERHEGDCTGQKGGGLDGMADLIHFRDKISTIFENPQEKSADSALNRIQVAQNQWFKKFIEKIKKTICSTQIRDVAYTHPAGRFAEPGNNNQTTNYENRSYPQPYRYPHLRSGPASRSGR